MPLDSQDTSETLVVDDLGRQFVCMPQFMSCQ